MAGAAVAKLVQQCLSAGREKWPNVALDDDALRPVVSARIESSGAVPEHVAELFVAAAASLGDLAATDWLHMRIAAIAPSVARRVMPAAELDEVVQRVSIKVLIADDGPARIDTYGARGPIEGWLRAVILRTALTMRRRRAVASKLEIDETAWLGLPLIDDDAASLGTWRRFAPALRSAFEASIAALSMRSRVALRQHFIDGLSADRIGRIHGVHRITAYRWIAEAKREVLERLRVELATQLDVAPTELDSLIRNVRSRFSITVERVLKAGARRR
jgi:RNA polymerase sigma-70 factor (ECF subfamily)